MRTSKEDRDKARAMSKLYVANRQKLIDATIAALEPLGFTGSIKVKSPDAHWNTVATIERGGIERELTFTFRQALDKSYSLYGRSPTGRVEVEVRCVKPSRTLKPHRYYSKGATHWKDVSGESLAKVLAKAYDQAADQEEADRLRENAEAEAKRIARKVNAAAGRDVCSVPWSYHGCRDVLPSISFERLDESQMLAVVTLLREKGMLDVLEAAR